MEPELFDAPISVSDSRLSLNCDCKRGRINEVTMMDEIGDSLNQRKKMEPELFDVPISVSDSRLSLNCNCRRKGITEVTIMDLPAEIMVEILTKLPINMIFRYARPRKFPCILLSKNYSVRYLLELGADYDYTSQSVNRPIILHRNLHLAHPVDLVSEDDDLYGVGGFDKTNLTLIDVSELEVYTLGVDEKNWRNMGKAPSSLWGNLSGVNVNNTIHWMDDGEILMQSERGTQLVSYNPKEEMLKVVNVYGSATEVTRYIPSFYSLNTVMGDNFQISNAYRRTQIV
ncbi:hypothetical protein KY284_025504 [Solanum tuberosum]|nr:hypothetical protein KY284_025504 [Solanum tuberosum]